MTWRIFDAKAVAYEDWYATPKGQRVDRAERELIAWLLRCVPSAGDLLDIGCGTGHFTHWLHAQGKRAIGLDRSPGMLATMRGRRPDVPGVLGDADHLPIRSRGVEVVLFVTSLEFLSRPQAALAEAVRVARSGLILVVLNRWSLGGLSRRVGPQALQPLLGQAHDYSLPALQTLVRDAAQGRLQGLHWRSGVFPRNLCPTPSRLPLGDVIGLAATLR
jgi:ubiquinone/menaquinone biosynthesis C-methylase UbiE